MGENSNIANSCAPRYIEQNSWGTGSTEVKNAISILLGSILIAAAILVAFRSRAELRLSAGDSPILTEIDRWTGRVTVCRWAELNVRVDDSVKSKARRVLSAEEAEEALSQEKSYSDARPSAFQELQARSRFDERQAAKLDNQAERGASASQSVEVYERRTIPICKAYAIRANVKTE